MVLPLPSSKPVPSKKQPGSANSRVTSEVKEQKWRSCGKIKWQRGQILGAGTFGKVYLAMTRTGELIAVKQVKMAMRTADDASKIAMVTSEIKLMEKLRHPNIVNLLGSSKKKDTLNILMEYVPGKSLDDMIKLMGAFKESVVRNYTKQILSALAYCHSKNVLHRDIKGKNILVDAEGNCKLADFGSAKIVDSIQSIEAPSDTYSYTPLWVAPEVMTGRYTSKVDVWSLGCVVIEMASGREPWSEQRFGNHFQALYHIGRPDTLPEYPAGLSAVGVDFLNLCLTKDPAKRPDAATLLRHPFITEAIPDSDSDDDEEPIPQIRIQKQWRPLFPHVTPIEKPAPGQPAGAPAEAKQAPSHSYTRKLKPHIPGKRSIPLQQDGPKVFRAVEVGAEQPTNMSTGEDPSQPAPSEPAKA